MQIEIDPASDVPIYQQLRDRVVEGIANGELGAGDALASVRQLAVEFGINVATVGKGYDMLRQEGLVRTNRRSGSVVARGPHDGAPENMDVYLQEGGPWYGRLRTLLAEAVAQGVPDHRITASVASILSAFAASRSAQPNPAARSAARPKEDR